MRKGKDAKCCADCAGDGAFERRNATHSSCKRCSKRKGRTDLDAKVEDRWESSVFRSWRLLLRDLPRR